MNSGDSGFDAAEVDLLDQQIAALQARAVAAHQAWIAADATLRATITRRDSMVVRLRAGAATPAPPAPSPAGTDTTTGTAVGADRLISTAPVAVRETSTRTVQNVLFILGGLLLGTAAIVFTAVAWTTFGVQGRAAILGVVTLVALAAPVVALMRKLSATAETVAAIALLLVLLDGYAAWSVNLFDAQAMHASRYAGLVLLAVVVVGLGYRLLTHLVGPAFVALLAVQPVLPLLFTPEPLSAAGWSLVWSGVAAVNLGVAWLTRAGSKSGLRQLPPIPRAISRVMSLSLYGLWLGVAAVIALLGDVFAETVTDRAEAGAAIIAVAAVFAASTLLSRSALLARCAGGAAVVAVAIAAGGVATAAWPGQAFILTALVALAAALAAVAAQRMLPAQVRPGPAVGAALVAGSVGLFAGPVALISAIATIDASVPLWNATLSVTGPHPPLATWQLPIAVLLVAAALALCLPRRWRPGVVATGAVLALVALPGSFPLAWWAPSVLSLGAAAVAGVLLLLGRPIWVTRPAGVSALVLALNAVATAGARPVLSALVLGAITVLSVVVAVIVAGGRDRPSRPASSALIARVALGLGLLAAPPAVGSALVAAEVPSWWAARGAVITVGVLVLALGSLRGSRWSDLALAGYRPILVNAFVWPTVGALTGDESVGIYAAVSLLVVAIDVTVLTAAPSTVESATADVPVPVPAWIAPNERLLAIIPGTVAGVALAVSVFVPVVAVTFWPYAWLASVWSGPPSGVGLTPEMVDASAVAAGSAVGTAAVALAILAVVTAALAYARSRRPSSALAGLGIGGPLAILIGLVAVEAQWPTVPAATLLIGLTLALAAALTKVSDWRAVVAIVQAVVYIGAGVAGALAVEWTTLAALGAVMVTATVIGTTAASRPWRVAGWLAAVASAVAAAAAAGFAANLPARTAAFGVLAVAVLALFLGAAVLRPAREVEATATEAAAHAGAVVAVIFTFGSTGRTALVCLLWGIAVGVRALLPRTSRSGRATLAAVAAGFELLAWWLLLNSQGVTLVEAYTVPLALVALLAGWAALRTRPELRSWVAYGPALVAGFAPSLAVVLGAEGAPLRRLALGAAALGVVVLGSVAHRQAPVVIGGVVLALVALHELVLLWQRVPGWIPLAVGGLILLALAITYERRLRDLRSLRTAIGRMT